MGNNSPSRFRSEGRNAYYRGGNPEEACQYKGWTREYHLQDFVAGWKQAADSYVPPEEKPMGYIGALRENFTDEQINAMSVVELLEQIAAIDEQNIKGF